MIVILAHEGPALLNDLMTDGFQLSDVKGVLDEASKNRARESLARVECFCERMQLPVARGRIGVFRDDILNDDSCTGDFIRNEFYALWRVILQELETRKMVFVLPDRTQFLEQDALFSEVVNQAFPSARLEIKAAGNCLTMDLNTAAVFHLMRVVEIGLRALAKQLGVTKVKKSVSIEFATLGEVIGALDEKTNASVPKSKKGRQDSDFYKGLFIEFRAFKDLWRDKVMHTRGIYDEHTARTVFLHVSAFMRRLAEKVKE